MNSASEMSTARRLLLGLFLLFLSGIIFFFLQNNQHIIGGEIALSKLLWLAFALFYWFIVPLSMALDKNISTQARLAFRIFFINMMARAIIELWMMYISVNWHPWYGIAHDLFSLVLIVILLRYFDWEDTKNRWLPHTLRVMGFMLVIEIGFVFYLLHYVAIGPEPVYFVPDNGEHFLILGITWAVVGLLSLYTLLFYKRLLHGTVER
ncbi:MAG TPA: hypothetical protein ENK04_03995 [Gammaproteobacteria bacterium]|nr:hypothetical protein [Gammaproteobacteria bacterium]